MITFKGFIKNCIGSVEYKQIEQEWEHLVKKAHPEDYCQKCGEANPMWYCDNNLFNRVNDSPNGILCLNCFYILAQEKGISLTFIESKAERHYFVADVQGSRFCKDCGKYLTDEIHFKRPTIG